MSENMKLVGGIVTTAIISVGLTLGLIAPAAEEHSPPEAPAVTANCPDGWADKSDTPQDTIVYSCTKDGWIVILTPDKKFERGWKPGLREWTTNPREVDGWPE